MVDALRHLSVFKPAAFGSKEVHIIGCGATGSKIAMSVAKLGVENIHLWDFDKVEEHNIPNQIYTIPDINRLKVEALAEHIKIATGTDVIAHNAKVDGSQDLGTVVFLLTDSMKSRKEIWENGLKYKMRTDLMIETRMGADAGRIYTVNPNFPLHIEKWEAASNYGDEEAEVSACGASTSVGPTADVIAGYAVWQMIRWASIEQGIMVGKEVDAKGVVTEPGCIDVLENELIISLRTTTMVMGTKFE
jgi:molybdopterin/thiamine biosynthesis adenylyltransferase